MSIWYSTLVDKVGSCPAAVDGGSMGLCVEECSGDESCGGNQKCCSNGCGHSCIEPAPGNCIILFSLCLEINQPPCS